MKDFKVTRSATLAHVQKCNLFLCLFSYLLYVCSECAFELPSVQLQVQYRYYGGTGIYSYLFLYVV